MKLPKIIGIAGTNGAGKDTLGELLAELQQYKFVSVSDILREELTRQGIPHEREHMRALSTKWASEHGPAVLSVKTIESYVEEEKREGYKGLVIGSIRRVAEAKAVHEEGGVVIWVDADRQTRYERLQKNSRGRSEDRVSYEDWASQEDAEMHPIGGDPNALNMAALRDVVDIKVDNNFASQQEYRDFLIAQFYLTTN